MQNEARGVEIRGIDKAFGRTDVLRGIDLSVAPGESMVLLGPSGCGKTTLLRLIAGLERPDSGTISVGGVPMVGPGVWTPPERRNVGMVFQEWALFSHLSVAANVGYGLKRGPGKEEKIADALAMVGLAGLGDREPDTLSGGQQQRVALARSIAPEPSVLLLDEPFSNLDASLRVQVRREVHELLTGLNITSILVTHDQDEAFVLGDRVAVMNGGAIEQVGTPKEIYRSPASADLARFVGDVNLLRGSAEGGAATTVVGEIPLLDAVSGEVEVLVRPEDLVLASDGPHEVTLVEYHGHEMLLAITTACGRELKVRTSARETWACGDRVGVSYAGAPAQTFV